MHELSLCEDLLRRLHALALEHGATGIARVELRVGLLSGVEPALIASAFALAAAGTLAEGAALGLETERPRVRCVNCGREAEVPANRLRCPHCRSAETRLVAGDALLLSRVELLRPETAGARAREHALPGKHHV